MNKWGLLYTDTSVSIIEPGKGFSVLMCAVLYVYNGASVRLTWDRVAPNNNLWLAQSMLHKV